MTPELFFWGLLSALFYIYFGYPLFLWILSAISPRPVGKQAVFPEVSVLISAYNEESHIRETIENKLSQNYPKEKLEVIVISDGSSDRTEEIVRSFAGRGVRLIVQQAREGKTAALNRAVPLAKGEIIVFSDANSIYKADALSKIVENFSDPQVGYVTGKMVYVDESGSLIGDGCTAYMRYENILRKLETSTGSLVGVDGGIDAVRKSLYAPMRADLLPDFVLPLSVVKEGYRVAYEEQSILKEHTLTAVEDEWRMRVRVILRSFHALWFMKSLFNPFRYGIFSFQLFSHKLLRYMAGFLQAGVFAANVLLLDQGAGYRVIFILQIIFYLLAVCGFLFQTGGKIGKLFSMAYYFCILNLASMLAFFKFLQGKKQTTWQPRVG